MKNNFKIIISGGGTGGHIFPAISIADELKNRFPESEILFVGANNRMEMERVPAAGYKIIGLPVQGLKRKITLQNIKVLADFIKSQKQARKIISSFKPDIAIGVGGYASAPLLRAASRIGIPCLIQEQNSYAGVTNRLLAKKVSRICVAYNGMEKYFPADKIIITGNPVRNISINNVLKLEGLSHFKLHTDKPILFIMGGSLGARTLNNSVISNINQIAESGVQVLWQTGKYYYNSILSQLGENCPKHIHILDFVSRMDLAYNVSDLIISRAGALSLSELCLVGKPSVLVPSPNVAEDHQTKNAKALADVNAAIMIADKNAEKELINLSLNLINNKEKLSELGENAKKLAKPDATKTIVDEVIKLIAKQ